MDPYPDSEFPWTFYFQGSALPKWSNCWCWVSVPDSDADWYFDQVTTRMDHAGNVESEESEVFTIAAQQTLLALIDSKDLFTTYPEVPPEQTRQIYESMMSGIQEMISTCEKHEVVFWTSGYEADQKLVQDAVAGFQLGADHPDYFHPPHRSRRKSDRLFTLNQQRKELRRRIDTLGANKALKTFLHNLKDKKG